MTISSEISTPIRIELPTGLAVGPVNAYLFTEPEPVLVDCGIKTDECLQALRAAINAQHLTFADLTDVIISHPHIDHCGLLGVITAESQATVHIFEPAKIWLTDYHMMWQQRIAYFRDQLFVRWQLYQDIAQPILDYYFGIEHAQDDISSERVKTFQADDLLMMGGQPWRVLHMPGHCSTLTCFYQPDTRQFLSTDMLLHIAPTPIPEPPPVGQTERTPSLPQFLESLKVVELLDCDMVYPGHGSPITEYRTVIQRQRDRIESRKLQCLQLIQDGHSRLGELMQTMYAHYPPQARFAGLWMTIGYLDLLAAEDKIKFVESEQDGIVSLTIQAK